MSAEIAYYERPEGQSIMTKSRDTFGVVVWPDPGTPGLTAEQSAALVKFHDTVNGRAARPRHRRAGDADLSDHGLCLRRCRPCGRAFQPAGLRQHLFADHESHH